MFTPSKYQSAIFEAVEKTSDNLVIDAVAGSGKTTTIVEALKVIPSSKRVLFVAFNKHIAEALKPKIPAHCEAMTLNAFGWRICKNQVDGIEKLAADKTEQVLRSFYDMDNREERNKFYKLRHPVSRVVSLLKANCYPSLSLQILDSICQKYDIEYPASAEDFLAIVSRVYYKCLNLTTLMDFDDQIFMPIYMDLAIPQYDILMVDESQDLNPIQIELVLKAGKRIIAVGDTRQAIYGFRGADPEAMSRMIEATHARVLPLSICYRCPKKVVETAQHIVSHIECSPLAADGIVADKKLEDFRKEISDRDYVLCRTTAPLVSECLKVIRSGKKATVRGRDIGQSLVALVEKICPSEQTDVATFYDALQAYHMQQLERLQKVNKEAEIIALNDRVDTIVIFIEEAKTVGDIKRKIESIFTDTAAGITFCTVHRSKGLEADRIYILEPGLLPHPAAKQEWQKKQEMNLKYVAITRAMKELYWVGSSTTRTSVG